MARSRARVGAALRRTSIATSRHAPMRSARSTTLNRSRRRWQLATAHATTAGSGAGSSWEKATGARASPSDGRDGLGRAGAAGRRRPRGPTSRRRASARSSRWPRDPARPCARRATSTPLRRTPRGRGGRRRRSRARVAATRVLQDRHVAASQPRANPSPHQGRENAGRPDLGSVQAHLSPVASACISSRWLTACSIPDDGAVRPATPIAIPPRVRKSASSVTAPGWPRPSSVLADRRASRPERIISTIVGE